MSISAIAGLKRIAKIVRSLTDGLGLRSISMDRQRIDSIHSSVK